MASTTRLSLRRSKRHGLILCAIALGLGLAFVYGLWLRAYWALALPVGAGVFTVLGLAFWVGWTIRTIDTIPPRAEHYETRAARRGALAICAAAAVLAAAFVAGVAAGSYWALAVPVAVATLGLLGMVFHIGWAIFTRRTTLPQPQEPPAGAPTGATAGEAGSAGGRAAP